MNAECFEFYFMALSYSLSFLYFPPFSFLMTNNFFKLLALNENDFRSIQYLEVLFDKNMCV